MTLTEIRTHAITVARETAERLRENARDPHPLPYAARRYVFDLILFGHPQLAALALDEYLAEQAVGA